jgi:hypothetical protein
MAHSTEFWPPTVSGFASEHHNDAQSRRCRGSDVEHLNRAFRSYGHFRKYRSCDPLLSQLISRNIMTVAVSSPLVRSVRGPREPAIGTRLCGLSVVRRTNPTPRRFRRRPQNRGSDLGERRVEMMGLEPTTPCLQSRCSSQLSYIPECRPNTSTHKTQSGVEPSGAS